MEEKSDTINVAELKPLSPYINDKGLVDYEALKNDKWLSIQLDRIANMEQSSLQTKNEKLAFWLNAYNLLTIKAVLEKLEDHPDWDGNLGFWSKLKFFKLNRHKVAQEKHSLDYIEHKIIRKQFDDPRVHFALNCGSASCPVLFDRLFKPEKIEWYLNSLAENFVNDPMQVSFDEKSDILYVSKIFKWYRDDFKNVGGIKTFVKKYMENIPKGLNDAKIKFRDYDWSLNAQT